MQKWAADPSTITEGHGDLVNHKSANNGAGLSAKVIGVLSVLTKPP